VSQSPVPRTYYVSTALYFFRLLPLHRRKSTVFFFQATRKPAPHSNPQRPRASSLTPTHTLLLTPSLLSYSETRLIHPRVLAASTSTDPLPFWYCAWTLQYCSRPQATRNVKLTRLNKLVTTGSNDMTSWRFRTERVFSLLQTQTWNNMQLSEQRWAVVNQEPRPPNPMGLFLAVLGWLLDTKLPWVARMIFAIYLVINHSYGKPPFTLMVLMTWVAIAQFTTYAFSHNCAITLYTAGDLFLIMLFNFTGHVYHDGPFDLKRLIYQITMWDLRLFVISSFG
jgi:hypothetical protein